jgi:hypothetical protein
MVWKTTHNADITQPDNTEHVSDPLIPRTQIWPTIVLAYLL